MLGCGRRVRGTGVGLGGRPATRRRGSGDLADDVVGLLALVVGLVGVPTAEVQPMRAEAGVDGGQDAPAGGAGDELVTIERLREAIP